MSLLGLRAFPRSVGMIAGAITLLATRDPYNALGVGIAAWFATFLIKSMLPSNIVDTNLWSCCSLPVNAIGAYPIRWGLYIIMVIIALVMGAPFTATLIAMGGLFFMMCSLFLLAARNPTKSKRSKANEENYALRFLDNRSLESYIMPC
jgi:hypothetical protein